MSPRTGRPHSENPKSESIHIRVTPDEKREIVDACEENGVTVLGLIKAGMNAIKAK